MSTTYRLFTNTSWGIIAKFASRISHALIAIFISRYLGVDATGSYNIGLTYFTIGLSFAVWGFDQNMILDISKDRSLALKHFGNLFILQTIFGLFVTICVYLISLVAPYPKETLVIVQVLSITIISESVIIICQSLFFAFEQFRLISIVNIITALIKFLISILMIYLESNVVEIVWVFTIISFFSMVIFMYLSRNYLPKPGFRFDWRFGISQLMKSMIFFIISLLYSLDNRIDILVLSFLSTDYYVGLYSAALGIVTFFFVLPQAFRDAIFPLISRLHFSDPKSAEKLYRLASRYILLLTMPIALVVCILAQEIVLIIYKEPFIDAARLLSISIWVFPIFSMMVFNTRLLIIDQKGINAARMLIISPILLLILNIILYPLYGITISSVIKVVSPLIVTIIIIWLVNTHVYKANIQKYIFQLSISLLVMGVIVNYTKSFSLIISLSIGIIIYLGMLYLLKVFNQEDFKYWRSIIGQIKKQFNIV